jgi:uncharacterized protein YbaP (TraB family)
MNENGRGRWHHAVAGFLAAVLHVASAAFASANVPACAGRDMYAELQTTDPAAHARVRAAADATLNARAILWRIERAGVPPSHLFGTVHLTDDRVNALSADVRSALAGASRIALEIADMSPQGMAAAMAGLRELVIFNDGRKLDDLLGGEELEIARSALQATGIPREMAAAFRPWLVTLSLAMAPCERRRAAAGLTALDARLAEAGKLRGKPIIGLETIESQMRALAAVPEADQLQVLRVSLKYHDRSADLMETMIQRYLERDLGAMWPFQLELAKRAGLRTEAFASFEQQLVGDRNARMRDAALPLLREGGLFIGVGALHLPGRLGLVEMLRETGFTVTAVE